MTDKREQFIALLDRMIFAYKFENWTEREKAQAHAAPSPTPAETLTEAARKFMESQQPIDPEIAKALSKVDLFDLYARSDKPTPAPTGDEAVAVVSASEWRRAKEGRTFMAIPGSEADSSGDVLLYTRPVKLPERQELFFDSGTADVAFVRGWNACLDAITHVNEGGK